jgi:ribonuclease Z
MFTITILGNNSAVPSNGRHPSAQVLHIGNEHYLIDCGEGTQMQMTKFEIKRSRIDHIFISHLHGDHIFGLIALLSTYSLLHRVQPVTIFCHQPLKEIIDIQLNYGGTHLSYPINYIFLPDNDALIFENKEITVECIQLEHRIKCVGFVFKEKQKDRKIIKTQIDKYKVDVKKIAEIKRGFDYMDEKGTLIDNKLLTDEPPPSRSYAYISDTKFLPEIIDKIKNVDVLYHEATFKNEDELRAAETYHCTAMQAATIAKQANVKRLFVGHYSAKYKEPHLQELLLQAQAVFAESNLSVEGEMIKIN